MTKPQFALIPSAYKTNKIYSVLPVDGSGDLTFSRTSEATRIIEDGLIDDIANNIPKLNWLNSNCPSLLLEPQRTNSIPFSQDFSYWSKTSSTVLSNNNVSPTGQITASQIIANSGFSNHHIQLNLGINSGTKYTYSIFVKKSEISQVQLLCADSSSFVNWARLNFDLETLSEFGSNLGEFGYEDYGNGWIKLFVTGTTLSSGNIIRVGLAKDGQLTFTGDGAGGVYLFGGQLEQGAYPTSYIETLFSTSTRNIDLTFDVSLPYNSNEGTMFLDVKAFNNDGSSVIRLGDNGANIMSFTFSTNNNLFILINNAYSSPITSYTYSHAGERQKYAIKWQGDNYYIYINGLLVISALNTGRTFSSLSFFNFSGNYGFSNFQGEVYNTQIFDDALSNNEIINLTK